MSQGYTGGYVPAGKECLQTYNYLMNGNFNIWQRGTSFTKTNNTNEYFADRWRGHADNPSANTWIVSRQAFTAGQTDVPGEPVYYLRGNCSVYGGSGQPRVQHVIEDVRTLAGKTVTLSLWMKGSSAFTFSININQDFGVGGSSAVGHSLASGASLTTSWAKYTYTVALSSIVGQTIGSSPYIYVDIRLTAPAAGQIIDIAQVQLEEGATANRFEYPMFADQLAHCQRYYTKSYNTDIAPATATSVGVISARSTGTIIHVDCPFFTRMRTTPTIVFYSSVTGTTGKARNATTNADCNAVMDSQGSSRVTAVCDTTVASFDRIDVHYTAEAEL